MDQQSDLSSFFRDSAGATLERTSLAFGILETLIMAAYFASRRVRSSNGGPRIVPYLMFIGYGFCTGLCVQGYRICKVGGMRELGELPEWVVIGHLKKNKVIEYLYLPSVTFPKLALLILYTGIFATHSLPLRIVSYLTGIVMILLLVLGIWAPFLLCTPFAYNWDKSIKGGKCVDVVLAYRWISFPNLVTDLLLLWLCAPVFWGIKTSKGENIMRERGVRWGLGITFVVGNFGIVTSIIRFVMFSRYNLFRDYTYNGAKALTWTIIEPGVYLITACLVTMRPLLRWVVVKSGRFELGYFKSKSPKVTAVGKCNRVHIEWLGEKMVGSERSGDEESEPARVVTEPERAVEKKRNGSKQSPLPGHGSDKGFSLGEFLFKKK